MVGNRRGSRERQAEDGQLQLGGVHMVQVSSRFNSVFGNGNGMAAALHCCLMQARSIPGARATRWFVHQVREIRYG